MAISIRMKKKVQKRSFFADNHFRFENGFLIELAMLLSLFSVGVIVLNILIKSKFRDLEKYTASVIRRAQVWDPLGRPAL